VLKATVAMIGGDGVMVVVVELRTSIGILLSSVASSLFLA